MISATENSFWHRSVKKWHENTVAGTGPRVFVDTGVGLQFLDMYVRWPG